MNELLVTVEKINGILVTTSNRVAEELGVRHDNLLNKINDYVNKFSSPELSGQFYIPSEYKTRDGRTARNYLITKKGIAQLIGGYSSAVEKAFDLNVAYINRFEEMENIIKGELSSKDKLLLNVIKASTDEERALAMNNYENNYVKPLEIENKQQKEYIDHVIINQKYYITSTQIGNKFNMSATKLNKILNNIGVIYKKGEKWYLTSDYYGIGDYGYFQKPNGDWEKGTSLRYSNEGEKKIYEILILHGYEPVKTVA